MDLPHRIYTGKEVERLYRDLLLADAGGTVDFGAAQALVAGGSNVDGVASTASRSDHIHAWPTHHATHEDGGADEISIADLGGFSGVAGDVLHGDGTFSTPALAKVFDGRAAGSGLHAHSDDFTTNTIANWTEWDEGTYQTSAIDTAYGAMVIEGTGNGAFRYGGRYKAIPSNTFTFAARVSIDGAISGSGNTNATAVGLIIGEDFGAANKYYVAMELVRNEVTLALIAARTGANYTTSSSVATLAYTAQEIWLRMRISISGSVTTYDVDWSSNGVTWIRLQSASTTATAIKHYGVGFFQRTNGFQGKGSISNFRVWDGVSGFYATRNGNYLGS